MWSGFWQYTTHVPFKNPILVTSLLCFCLWAALVNGQLSASTIILDKGLGHRMPDSRLFATGQTRPLLHVFSTLFVDPFRR
jgi:hypothetical protein